MKKLIQQRKGYTIKLTDFERAGLERAAARAKMKPSEFLRRLILISDPGLEKSK